jgi:hypothetical protein
MFEAICVIQVKQTCLKLNMFEAICIIQVKQTRLKLNTTITGQHISKINNCQEL